MKVFRILSTGWEVYGQHSLTHESKTKEEFEQDCKEVLTEVFKEVTDNLKKRDVNTLMGAYELMNFGVPKLIERGYKFLEFECDYLVPGDDGSFLSNSSSRQEAIDSLGEDVVEAFLKKARMKKYRL